MRKILIILFILFSNVLFSQNIKYKNDSLTVFLNQLDNKKLNQYFSINIYKKGPNKFKRIQDGSCNDRGTVNKVFVFWSKNKKTFLNKFDDCSSYQSIEISKFPIDFVNDYKFILNKEKIKEYYSTVIYDDEIHEVILMDTKGREYNFHLESVDFKIDIDLNDFSNPKNAKNENFEFNSKLKIFALNQFCEKLITDLENDNQFVKIE